MEICSATPGDLAPLVSLLDKAFIFGKQRTISLRRRFPTVFCDGNLENILLCREGKDILAALAMRRFIWRDGGKYFDGAMIGCVHTRPEQRGKGLASRLLETAAERLRGNTDFGVLWTTQPAFYERLGWEAADCGLLGETMLEMTDSPSNSPVTRVPAEKAGERIEAIRERWLHTATLLRHPIDGYRQLPPPAITVEALLLGKTAYALLGHAGETAILYEMAGDPDGFPSLWQELRRTARRLLANERKDSPSQCWLAANTTLSWQDKPLAMRLPLSPGIGTTLAAYGYIPHFDRI